MEFHENFSHQRVFKEGLSFNNFVGFVVTREYIDGLRRSVEYDEESKYKFYKFLLMLVQDVDSSVFPCLTDPFYMSPELSRAVLARIENLRNVACLIAYVDRKYVMKTFSCCVEEMVDCNIVKFHRNSLVGQFMRKFANGFNLMYFDEICEFATSFYGCYDSFLREGKPMDLEATGVFGPNQMVAFSEDIIKKAGQLGSLDPTEIKRIRENLRKCQEANPDLPTPHYASHMLALRERDLSEAERSLFKAFEMAVSIPTVDAVAATEPKSVDAWNRMALAASDMHHRFGQDQKARSYLNQALAQALEMNDNLSLRYTKMAHEMLNQVGEPFRYETFQDQDDPNISQELLLSELLVKLYKLLGTGTDPQTVLLTYFNSVVAHQSGALAIVLLNMATVFSFYGYTILGCTLLQCVIFIDCLNPCAVSDSVLSLAFSQLARSFVDAGAPSMALEIIHSAAKTIGRFEEFDLFERARVETQLEQALRLGLDLNHCSRLIQDLTLFCPWEAFLRRASLEEKRGNCSLAADILRALVGRAEQLRTRIGGGGGRSDVQDDEELRAQVLHEHTDTDDVLTLCRVLKPPSSGGVASIARFEVRARIATANILSCRGLHSEALVELEAALALSRELHMGAYISICSVLRAGIVRARDALLPQTSVMSTALGAVRPRQEMEKGDLLEVFANVNHQTDHSMARWLTNAQLWLAVSSPNPDLEVVSVWQKHLLESAAFFAAIADKTSLERVVNLFKALKRPGGNMASDLLDCMLPFC